MAEAIAVVGLVLAIVQLIDLGAKVTRQIQEFKKMPDAFQKVSDELPLLILTLKSMQRQVNPDDVGDETTKALKPVVEGCLEKVRKLEGIF